MIGSLHIQGTCPRPPRLTRAPTTRSFAAAVPGEAHPQCRHAVACCASEPSFARVLLAAALLLAACSPVNHPVSLSPPKTRPKSADYGDVLETWTRHGRVVRQLDTPLNVYATLFSPTYAAAYAARYVDLFKLPAPRRQALERELEQGWNERFELVFAAATHDIAWNDFHRKRSAWRIALVNDRGDEVEPVSIEREKRSPTWEVLYPYVEGFYELYRVRFPRQTAAGQPLVTGGTRHLALRFAGALGHVDLIWRLR